MMENLKKQIPVQMKNVSIMDEFWSGRIDMISSGVIPYQWDALNDKIPGAAPSHAVENFRIAAGELAGEFRGEFFQDSDLAKWIEAASYSLISHPDKELRSKVDEAVELIEKAQFPDGYINTYFTVAEPGKRFTNLRDKHELYCAGHLIEAAVAYYQATGKKSFLNAMCRYADYIDSVFGTEQDKRHGYDGHEEIELALIKLYRVTGNVRYLNLSKYFIDERGKEPYYFDLEAKERNETIIPYPQHAKRSHLQAHLPVREQTTAEGHAVRLAYLCCGMADVAMETGDKSLLDACKNIWNNVTGKRMYVTGGIGSTGYEEAFTIDYDLPNRRAYAETCAAIGMVFWAQRMLQMEQDGKYADVMERALYNGVLSGISLDGKRYFYVNPLEVWPEEADRRIDLQHVKSERVPWYGCACCPPNIARLLASIGEYIYTCNDHEIFVNLFIGSEAEFKMNGSTIRLKQEGGYPWDGSIAFTIDETQASEFTLALRIPGWCKNAGIRINESSVNYNDCLSNGYCKITRRWNKGDRVVLSLQMPVELVRSNPQLRENAGKVAIQRGPIVYCLDEADNGKNLQDISLPEDASFIAEFDEKLLGGVTVIKGRGLRTDETIWDGELYTTAEIKTRSAEVTAVPYYCWGNREPGEMLTWIRKK